MLHEAKMKPLVKPDKPLTVLSKENGRIWCTDLCEVLGLLGYYWDNIDYFEKHCKKLGVPFKMVYRNTPFDPETSDCYPNPRLEQDPETGEYIPNGKVYPNEFNKTCISMRSVLDFISKCGRPKKRVEFVEKLLADELAKYPSSALKELNIKL